MIHVLLLLTVVGSALFAGLETGIVTLNRVRLRARARRGDHAALHLQRLLQSPDRVLASFLVGNTLCNIGGGALASAWAVQKLGDEALGSLVATVTMSAIFLVFCELMPKAYFRIRGEREVPRLLWFIRLFSFLFQPIVWATTSLLRLVTRGAGRREVLTRDEVRQLVREGGTGLGARERRMLQSVFDFGRTVAREVMIPLPDVVSLPEAAPTEELLDLARRERFTRIPLYRNRVDAIVGLANVFDVLYDREPAPEVVTYRRPIHVVPETSLIHRVLVELQRRRETMALVVNEFGACIGIVTVEDIVEEIMGELADEHEELPQPIQQTGDGYVVDATLDIDDLNDELGLSLPKDRFDTVGGLVLRRLGRIPRVGETVQAGPAEFEVLAVHQYGIRRIRVRLKDTEGN
jgi:CBS domain containing-hemolysin-like protein